MKFRTNARYKARKRKSCWANDHRKKSKMESSVDISTVNKDSGENNDLNNLNNIFNNITNRSAEKLQSNSIFHNFDTDNSNNRPVTRRSQISNILNENQMENQPVSGYCLMKMENINDIFSNSTACGQCKKGGMKLFENKCIEEDYAKHFFQKISGNLTATISDHLPQFTIIPNMFGNISGNKSKIYERDWSKFD